MLDDVSTSMPHTYTHKQACELTSHITPVLDGGAAVGTEVTAAEGAPGDTGMAVNNVMQCNVSHVR